MKKLSALLSLIVLTQLISACSQGRYTHYQQPQRNQQQAAVQQQSAQQQRAQQQGQRYSQQSPSRRQVQNSAPQSSSQQASRPQFSQQTQQSAVYDVNPARNRMVQIATSAIGTRYKWGGDSPQKGFDCSGLMTYVHKNALGMNIPRTTANQRDRSRTIPYQQLQPGDMLFFKTGARTNHVGVYIGNRKFVHAPSSGKRVTVASMDNAYWHKRFVKFGSFL
ncbi:hypothetical protein GCM10009133_39440 [Cocleimonas flava]|uniref:Cell wall-associated NlpC family hydrolase n=1 Tax=Cocleimonas flava TaxID=634765 RepID=A0A4R1F8Q2_9GAMM|nr:C40 family peptidase [Cocleimonas flava]TCJ88218.1 cell wall-associated NlpC family hydrolase [Cocleimonas flava]